jgi:riboflavin synthase
MFTGIVAGGFAVRRVEERAGASYLVVGLDGERVAGLQPGASVAVDGVCLTAVEVDGLDVHFDVVGETLERTTLGSLRAGDRVNIERSCRVGDEIGGHVLGGHVLGTGRVSAYDPQPGRYSLEVSVPEAWLDFIHEKGFIAVDGCSLTVGKCVRGPAQGRFELHLIPETLRRTGLESKRVGDRVNVELDASEVAIVRTVERVLAQRRGVDAE